MSRGDLLFPHDPVPCTICQLKPRVYKRTPTEKLFVCARCGAPYVLLLDDRGRLIEPPTLTLPPFAKAPLIEYWKSTRSNVAPGAGVAIDAVTEETRAEAQRVAEWLDRHTPEIHEAMLVALAQELAQKIGPDCAQQGAEFVLWITDTGRRWSTYVSSLQDHERVVQAMRECATIVEAGLDLQPGQRPGSEPPIARFTTRIEQRGPDRTRVLVHCDGETIGILALPNAKADALIQLLHTEQVVQ